ncbi:MAG: hypothetical protein CM1200mP25_2180 [Acidobacteriota bacterium]|nr:MAG: hypothetical protein CM1200mP25_2180 [Acidobacteriota bacterium]
MQARVCRVTRHTDLLRQVGRSDQSNWAMPRENLHGRKRFKGLGTLAAPASNQGAKTRMKMAAKYKKAGYLTLGQSAKTASHSL